MECHFSVISVSFLCHFFGLIQLSSVEIECHFDVILVSFFWFSFQIGR